MKPYLMHIDNFIFPDKKVVYTEDHDKIEKNIQSFQDIYNKMQFAKAAKKPRLNLVFNCSNYIVCLNMDLTARKQSVMHFFEFNLNLIALLTQTPVKQLFSTHEINSILDSQKKLHQNIHVTQREDVYFTPAYYFELPSKFDNIYTCFDDNIVIEKAKELGVYYTIERTDLALQTSLIHELKTDKKNNKILDLYCFAHFEKKANPIDNGFVYTRFHDALNNPDSIDDFYTIITKTVGNFDKAFFINTLKGFMPN